MSIRIVDSGIIEFNGYDRKIAMTLSPEQTTLFEKTVAAMNNYMHVYSYLSIKDVIFSPPATIVFWGDGTKTIVKCTKGDAYNYETGVALCTLKKIFGEDYTKYKKYISEIIKEKKEEDLNRKLKGYVKELKHAIDESKGQVNGDEHTK